MSAHYPVDDGGRRQEHGLNTFRIDGHGVVLRQALDQGT